MKNLTIRFVLLILCALSTNTTFAQDVRQKTCYKEIDNNHNKEARCEYEETNKYEAESSNHSQV